MGARERQAVPRPVESILDAIRRDNPDGSGTRETRDEQATGMAQWVTDPTIVSSAPNGDINCDFPTYATQIPAGLNFAAAGMPYWTTDIGGYWGHPGRVDWTTSASNEMFTRWFQYGAFCPIFRIHGGGSRELYGSQWSATTKANLLKIDKLRYRLMPYIYSLAAKVTNEGYTIMRPVVFDYPNDSKVGSPHLPGPERELHAV